MIAWGCIIHYSILSCMRVCWLTRLNRRNSRKVYGHYFLSSSTPVRTEKKRQENGKTLRKSAILIIHKLYSVKLSMVPSFFISINLRQGPQVATTTNQKKG